MKLAVLFLTSGCYLHARGASMAAMNHRDTVDGGFGGDVDIGIGADDGKQGFGMMLGERRRFHRARVLVSDAQVALAHRLHRARAGDHDQCVRCEVVGQLDETLSESEVVPRP